MSSSETRHEILRRWARRAGPWVLIAAVLYLFGGGLGGGSGLGAGEPAPPLRVSTSVGATFDLAALRGRVAVVNFWGAWCPPCRAEAPALSAVSAELTARGGALVGLNTDRTDLEATAAAAARLGMRYPVAVASDEALQAFRVRMLPTTLVIAPDGSVAATFVGEVSQADLTRAITDAEARRPLAAR